METLGKPRGKGSTERATKGKDMICPDCMTHPNALCEVHRATDNHSEHPDLELELIDARRRVEELQAKWESALEEVAKLRDPRNYCGACGKTLSEPGICHPCSLRVGNERRELMRRKDAAEDGEMRLSFKNDALRAENDTLRAQLKEAREVLERIANHDPGADAHVRARAFLRAHSETETLETT